MFDGVFRQMVMRPLSLFGPSPGGSAAVLPGFLPSPRRTRVPLPEDAVSGRWWSYVFLPATAVVLVVAVMVPAAAEVLALLALTTDRATTLERVGSLVGTFTAGVILLLPVFYATGRALYAGYIENTGPDGVAAGNRPPQETDEPSL